MQNLDRMNDKHNGIAFIYFNGLEESRLDDIVLTRLFINNTKWPDTNMEVRCYWSRTKESMQKNAAEKQSNSNGSRESGSAGDSPVTIKKRSSDEGIKREFKNKTFCIFHFFYVMNLP